MSLVDATGDATETGEHTLISSYIDLPLPAQCLSILYRVVAAKGEDIGTDSSTPLTDNVGRTIYHTEGIVFPALSDVSELLISKDEFYRRIHCPIMAIYRDFWHDKLHDPDEMNITISLASLTTDPIALSKSLNCATHYSVESTTELPKQIEAFSDHRVRPPKQPRRQLRRRLQAVLAVLFAAISFTVIRFHHKKTQLLKDYDAIMQGVGRDSTPGKTIGDILTLSGSYSHKKANKASYNCVVITAILNQDNKREIRALPLLRSYRFAVDKNRVEELKHFMASHKSCTERMKNPIYAIGSSVRFVAF